MELIYPNFSGVWSNSKKQFGTKWERDISKSIQLMFGARPNKKWDEAIHGYAEFCTEALRAQVFFEKHKRYQATNYQEVKKLCYNSATYMNKRYLPGQFLSHSIWPHHFKMLQGFKSFLKKELKKSIKTFCEVGVGCGVYSKTVLEEVPGTRGTGIDISTYALRFTEKVVKAFGLWARYKTQKLDIFKQTKSEKYDLVICQEVLEHLENPKKFIAELYNMTQPGGWAYITAAINAGHTDHIYLYKTSHEVKNDLMSVPWKIKMKQIEFNYPEKPKHLRPTIAGFFLKKPI